MKVVFVEHPQFKAEVLHLSEMPDDILHGVKPDGFGLLDTVIELFRVGLIDPKKFDEFEGLKISQVLQCWALYSAAKPYEKEFFNG